MQLGHVVLPNNVLPPFVLSRRVPPADHGPAQAVGPWQQLAAQLASTARLQALLWPQAALAQLTISTAAQGQLPVPLGESWRAPDPKRQPSSLGSLHVTQRRVAAACTHAGALMLPPQQYLLPHGGLAPILPHGGLAPILPHGGLAPVLPHGGLAPILPHGGLAPVLPHGGLAPILPHQALLHPALLHQTLANGSALAAALGPPVGAMPALASLQLAALQRQAAGATHPRNSQGRRVALARCWACVKRTREAASATVTLRCPVRRGHNGQPRPGRRAHAPTPSAPPTTRLAAPVQRQRPWAQLWRRARSAKPPVVRSFSRIVTFFIPQPQRQHGRWHMPLGRQHQQRGRLHVSPCSGCAPCARRSAAEPPASTGPLSRTDAFLCSLCCCAANAVQGRSPGASRCVPLLLKQRRVASQHRQERRTQRLPPSPGPLRSPAGAMVACDAPVVPRAGLAAPAQQQEEEQQQRLQQQHRTPEERAREAAWLRTWRRSVRAQAGSAIPAPASGEEQQQQQQQQGASCFRGVWYAMTQEQQAAFLSTACGGDAATDAVQGQGASGCLGQPAQPPSALQPAPGATPPPPDLQDDSGGATADEAALLRAAALTDCQPGGGCRCTPGACVCGGRVARGPGSACNPRCAGAHRCAAHARGGHRRRPEPRPCWLPQPAWLQRPLMPWAAQRRGVRRGSGAASAGGPGQGGDDRPDR